MALRVGVVTEFCPPYRTGFYERFAAEYETRIFFCNSKDGWRAYGEFPYEEVPGYQFRDRYRIAPRVFVRLQRYDPDVVVGSPVEGFASHAGYIYARTKGIPFVLWTGEWHLPLTTLRTIMFPLIRRLYRSADAIAVYGPHVRDYLVDLGIEENKISIAWNTIDTSTFSPPDAERCRAIREELGIPADAPVVLYVGRLVKEKGVGYLLDAHAELSGRLGNQDPWLVVVGQGDRRQQLETRAADIPNTVFPGYVQNDLLPGYYGMSDVFVLPSIQTEVFREPWGLVVNEAMSCGTPVVATGQVGAAAAGVVKHGRNGYVVPERNVLALTDHIEKLLREPDLRKTFGSQARDDIAEYDYDRMLSGITEAFEHLGLTNGR